MLTMRAPRKAAEYFKSLDENTAITEAYIRRLIRDGDIPIIRNGAKVLVSIESIEEFVAEQLAR